MKTLAERVRWAREKRELSCAEVDEIADLSCGHTASVESGRRESPSVTTARKIAYALDIDIAWLINGGKAPSISA